MTEKVRGVGAWEELAWMSNLMCKCEEQKLICLTLTLVLRGKERQSEARVRERRSEWRGEEKK